MDIVMHCVAPGLAFLAGVVGGLISALMTDSGAIELPGAAGEAKGKVCRLAWWGHALIGGVAALASWGIYGAASAKSVAATTPADITWAALGAAILIGVGGSRWLSAEVDKAILQKTAEIAATKGPDPQLAQTISMGTPAQALQTAVAK